MPNIININDINGGGGGLLAVFIAPLGIDESENKYRYLNGQILIQSQFPAATAAIKACMTIAPNAFTTEENWQAEKTASVLGQCGKFVIDDDAGTIRLPCVVNINSLVDLANCGVIKNESLPNHYHFQGSSATVDDTAIYKFGKSDTGIGSSHYDTGGVGNTTIAPNTSTAAGSSAYQDNAPVQQEAVQYPYVICVNTGVKEAERPINNYQVNNVYSYGMSQYYKGTMNNNSWLKSAGQWNNGTVYTGMYNWALEQANKGLNGFKFKGEQSSQIVYQFRGNTTDTLRYTPSFTIRNPIVGSTFYGATLPVIPLGEVTAVNSDGSLECKRYNDTPITLEFLKQLSISDDEWISDYDWVINTDDQTFRLPLLNGQESIPDWDNYDTLTVEESGQTYTATTNGRYVFVATIPALGYFAIFHGNTDNIVDLITNKFAPVIQNYDAQADVKRGDTIMIQYGDPPTIRSARFYHAVCESGSLYFYVGDTLQNASLIDIAKLGEQITDIKSRRYVTEAWHEGTSWYRIWSDGWIEQGGIVSQFGTTTKATVSLLKVFTDTNYTVVTGGIGDNYTVQNGVSVMVENLTTSSFDVIGTAYGTTNGCGAYWRACGF